MESFEGKTGIVTGAGRGLGRDIALGLGRAGANVVVNYAASEKAATEVVQAIDAAGGKAVACQADVSKAADAERLVDTATETFGRVDILVNNAGINMDAPLLEMNENAWDTVLAVNLKGVFLCTQAAGRRMHAAEAGAIVNISAVTAFDARPNAANYAASKAGMNMLTKCAALELAPHVRVNGVALGFFRSEAVERYFSEAQIAEVVGATPLARMGEFGEVTAAVQFLCSDAAAFITGQTLIVDGGRTMR